MAYQRHRRKRYYGTPSPFQFWETDTRKTKRKSFFVVTELNEKNGDILLRIRFEQDWRIEDFHIRWDELAEILKWSIIVESINKGNINDIVRRLPPWIHLTVSAPGLSAAANAIEHHMRRKIDNASP